MLRSELEWNGIGHVQPQQYGSPDEGHDGQGQYPFALSKDSDEDQNPQHEHRQHHGRHCTGGFPVPWAFPYSWWAAKRVNP
jgi:hypothetical protein